MTTALVSVCSAPASRTEITLFPLKTLTPPTFCKLATIGIHHILPGPHTMPSHIRNPLDRCYLGDIPHNFTTLKLLKLGDTYLNHTASADAYIRAVPMKRPQLGVVRVRVLPGDRARRTVVMQKRFPQLCGAISFSALTKPAASTPIHVEYALYRAPLLAAILLSGHVKKGDTVEVPVPHPGVWKEVMEWVYTGRGCLRDEFLAENLAYLGASL